MSEQVCSLCPGDLRNGTAVGDLCRPNASFVTEGRCCLQNQTILPHDNIFPSCHNLYLWNCSVGQVDLHEASTAIMIDLSENPALNLSYSAFQGFTALQNLVLPPVLEGEFPFAEVFGILGISMVLVTAALWFTQRRKAKPF
ncbi:all-trans retinoic acid-induced differentiation factor [Amia ocellicauda]|uniref:all-trans retinoic acid-induced differentiation factor n=1 Tax=Amia ocellicauda TaxID=2972642 RepID=UPI0034645655